MKKVLYLFIALGLLAACEEPDPRRAAMEQYAKEHISQPDTYKFAYMGIEKEYKYINDLYSYRKGLEKKAEEAVDKAPWEAEMARVDALFEEVGYETACYEYSLYFHCRENNTPVQRVVLARYDADGNLMVITMDPKTLPTYPALQMLRDQGKL